MVEQPECRARSHRDSVDSPHACCRLWPNAGTPVCARFCPEKAETVDLAFGEDSTEEVFTRHHLPFPVLNCTAGTFDDAGVKDLNRRAEPVMQRLGVPMIHSYDFTQGQSWATIKADGRYAGMKHSSPETLKS